MWAFYFFVNGCKSIIYRICVHLSPVFLLGPLPVNCSPTTQSKNTDTVKCQMNWCTRWKWLIALGKLLTCPPPLIIILCSVHWRSGHAETLGVGTARDKHREGDTELHHSSWPPAHLLSNTSAKYTKLLQTHWMLKGSDTLDFNSLTSL